MYTIVMGSQRIRLLVFPLCILYHEKYCDIYVHYFMIMYNIWKNKKLTLSEENLRCNHCAPDSLPLKHK